MEAMMGHDARARDGRIPRTVVVERGASEVSVQALPETLAPVA